MTVAFHGQIKQGERCLHGDECRPVECPALYPDGAPVDYACGDAQVYDMQDGNHEPSQLDTQLDQEPTRHDNT